MIDIASRWTDSDIGWTVGWGLISLMCLGAIPGAIAMFREAAEIEKQSKRQAQVQDAVYSGIAASIGFVVGVVFLSLIADRLGSSSSDESGKGQTAPRVEFTTGCSPTP
ncbi:hypothetical protein ACRAWF_07780 [Streptomyces sp. L7]